jgi:hypothetical protein
MVWTSTSVTLGTAAVQVVAPDNMPHELTLHNASKSSNNYIYLGPNSSITTTNSFHMDNAQTISLTLQPGDELWALSDPTGLKLHIADVRKAD